MRALPSEVVLAVAIIVGKRSLSKKVACAEQRLVDRVAWAVETDDIPRTFVPN